VTGHDIGPLSDIPAGGCLAVTVAGRDIVVVRDGNEIFALENRCSHADVALSEGDVADGTIECWLHGSAFDLRTGEPLTPPATQPVDTFAVSVVGDGAQARILVDPDSTPETVGGAGATPAANGNPGVISPANEN